MEPEMCVHFTGLNRAKASSLNSYFRALGLLYQVLRKLCTHPVLPSGNCNMTIPIRPVCNVIIY